jgi:hypothetical protein
MLPKRKCLFDNTEWALLSHFTGKAVGQCPVADLECYDTTPLADRTGEHSKHLYTL